MLSTVISMGSSTYQRSSMGTIMNSDVFMDCHIIFDCSCMTCFSCFFTLAISFLSPDRAAFIDSLLHWLISLFQSRSCSLFVKSLLVVDVASEMAKDISMMKNVELGMSFNNSKVMCLLTLRRSV